MRQYIEHIRDAARRAAIAIDPERFTRVQDRRAVQALRSSHLERMRRAERVLRVRYNVG